MDCAPEQTAPDLEERSGPKLHGMQAFMPDGDLVNEHATDGLALIDTMGDSEDEDVTAERPNVLSPLVGNWDKI